MVDGVLLSAFDGDLSWIGDRRDYVPVCTLHHLTLDCCLVSMVYE